MHNVPSEDDKPAGQAIHPPFPSGSRPGLQFWAARQNGRQKVMIQTRRYFMLLIFGFLKSRSI